MVNYLDSYRELGINPWIIFSQIFTLITLVFYIMLIVKAISQTTKNGEAVEVPIWIFAIVLLLIFGPMAALMYYKYPRNN